MTANPRTVTVNANLNFVAIFEVDPFVECDPITSFPWNPTVTADGRNIVVLAPEGTELRIVDVLGRTLVSQPAGAQPKAFAMPAAGVYMVSLGDAPARKVVVY